MAARDRLGDTAALLIANPLPPDKQFDPALHDQVLAEALAAADQAGVRGKAVTPFLLAYMQRATEGKSVAVNLDVARGNIALAGRDRDRLVRPEHQRGMIGVRAAREPRDAPAPDRGAKRFGRDTGKALGDNAWRRAEEHSGDRGTPEPVLDAPITSVTVFTDGARVVRAGLTRWRRGRVPWWSGISPPGGYRQRPGGRPGDDLDLLNVEVRRRVSAEPLREEAARLRAEVERWRDAVQGLDDEDAAEQAGLGFLGHLSEAAATSLARAVSSGRAGYDELSGMAGHLSASTANTLARRREIACASGSRSRSWPRPRRACGGAGGGQQVEFVEVALDLEARADTEAEIELTYHVGGASWHPLYDLALDGERLNVSYLAEITQ